MLLMLCGAVCNATAQNLSSGEIIFVASEDSDFEKSIVEVTQYENNALNFTHVGIVNVTDTGIFIIEAVPQKGVVYSSLQEFKTENKNGTLYIASLKPEYQKYTKGALNRACSHLGKGYDYAFDLENDLYYCSELVYDAYAHATGDPHFFETQPMTFKKEGIAEFLPYWHNYFEKLNLPIPEGKPGINPNGLSQSGKLRITNYELKKAESRKQNAEGIKPINP
jgi:hypothetical protein